jgi:hypothetical protein
MINKHFFKQSLKNSNKTNNADDDETGVDKEQHRQSNLENTNTPFVTLKRIGLLL